MATLTFEQAREQLGFHSGRDQRIDDPRWDNGLLATLRPYRGLRRDAMESVMECVDAVAAHLMGAEPLDREVISSLWGICHFVRAWAIHPDGMLKRNGLISDADASALEDWLEDFSYRVSTLLDGVDEKGQVDPDGP